MIITITIGLGWRVLLLILLLVFLLLFLCSLIVMGAVINTNYDHAPYGYHHYSHGDYQKMSRVHLALLKLVALPSNPKPLTLNPNPKP